jgi:energy-coupling factor transporter ATP-binding protein EcfA2
MKEINKNKQIVLLNGKQGIGKSYLSNRFTKLVPNSQKLSLSSPLKSLCSNLLRYLDVKESIISSHLYGDKEYKNKILLNLNKRHYEILSRHISHRLNLSPILVLSILENKLDKKFSCRKLLQIVGTEIIRDQIDPNYFVKRLIEEIKISESKLFIIDDWRFENEIVEIKQVFPNTIGIQFKNRKVKVKVNENIAEDKEKKIEEKIEEKIREIKDLEHELHQSETSQLDKHSSKVIYVEPFYKLDQSELEQVMELIVAM